MAAGEEDLAGQDDIDGRPTPAATRASFPAWLTSTAPARSRPATRCRAAARRRRGRSARRRTEPRREPEPGEPGGLGGPPLDPPRERDAPDGLPAGPTARQRPPAARGRNVSGWAARRPSHHPCASANARPRPSPRRHPTSPRRAPGSFAPPGYGTSPVPPGAFAAPAAAAAREPWVLAEWWRRAVAAIIDGVIVSVVALLLLIPLVRSGSRSTPTAARSPSGAGLLVFLLLLVIASFLYAPLLMARTNGQTLGKMAVGIRVVRANGRAVDFGWAFLREVVVKRLLFGVLLSSFTFGLASLLDCLWPLWDSENRALHDIIVDSRVIRA